MLLKAQAGVLSAVIEDHESSLGSVAGPPTMVGDGPAFFRSHQGGCTLASLVCDLGSGFGCG